MNTNVWKFKLIRKKTLAQAFCYCNAFKMNNIWLMHLPMPPTSNHLYMPKHNRLIKNRSKRSPVPKFEIELRIWAHRNALMLKKTSEQIKDWIAQGLVLKVDSFFCFPNKDLFSKDGAIKKKDARNRPKLLDDQLSQLLEIDDSYFFAGNVAKVITKEFDGGRQYCHVKFSPIKTPLEAEISDN